MAFSPILRAVSRPGACSRLLTTKATLAGIFPAAALRAIASKFDPRPESKMPMFFMDLRQWQSSIVSVRTSSSSGNTGMLRGVYPGPLHFFQGRSQVEGERAQHDIN